MKPKILTTTLVIIALLLGGLIYYLSNIRVETITNYTVVEKRENDPTKTNEEAEKINLSNVPKKIIPTNELQESIYFNIKSDASHSETISPGILQTDANGSIQNIASDELKSKMKSLSETKELTPLIFVNKGTKIKDRKALVENIKTQLINNNFNGIDIDYSLVAAVDDYPQFIKDLSKIITILDKKLIISVLPKWSDYVNYNYWSNFSDFYTKTINLKDLSQYASTIRIHAYTYTTIQSSLPGQITPPDWLEQIIQYNIKSGLPREKIEVVINTSGYRWTDREIANTIKDNVVLPSVQVIKHTQEELAKLEQVEIKKEGWNEKSASTVIDGKNYIVIYPTDESINNIKKVIADYGLRGYVLF